MKNKSMSFILVPLMLTGICVQWSIGQKIKETVQPLSKQATKGYIDNGYLDDKGQIRVVYAMRNEKNKKELKSEEYLFDNDLNFVSANLNKEDKEMNPDREQQYMRTWVGGWTSFDINSMKIRLEVQKVLETWNYKKQYYEIDKVLERNKGKIKNEKDRPYYGIDDYWDDEQRVRRVLAYVETKDKVSPKKFVFLTIDFDGNVTERPIDISGRYSMVYCKELSEAATGKAVGKQDIIMILAPGKGQGDPSEYVYLHYDIKGNLKNKLSFKSPTTNLLVTAATVVDGEVFLFAQSVDSKDPYESVFEDYAPMENPNYVGDDENAQMAKYNKAASERMDFFHVLKISGKQLMFATTTPIENFKSKLKIPPSEKGVTPYKGKKFDITMMEVTPNNEYLVTGQLRGRKNFGSLKDPYYLPVFKDILCFHFDSKGELKAQYAVDKKDESKFAETALLPQQFYFTADGKSAYWEILEVKDIKNAWTGNFAGVKLFARLGKIDLQNSNVDAFTTLGDKDYFLYGDFPAKYLPDQNSVLYLGCDKNEKNLWLCKVKLD